MSLEEGRGWARQGPGPWAQSPSPGHLQGMLLEEILGDLVQSPPASSPPHLWAGEGRVSKAV